MSPFASSHAYATVSYAEAVATIEGYAALLACSHPPETVSLPDALGRVLAEPVLADRDQPPFPRSTRDGFACRASAVASGAPLKVIGLLKAGESWPGSRVGGALDAEEAVEIMTGAPLPVGADCVVMIEHVERTADVIRLMGGRRIEPGENFIPAGAEARSAATLVTTGTRLGPSQIAAAASVGASRLRVYPRPKVAILSTGDELVSLDTRPLPFQIRNSNSYSLAAQVLALGGEPLIQPIAADSEHALEQSVRAAVTGGCNLLLLSGGVSMGKYDLVEGVLASLGAGFFFTGVRIQPGKPVVFGELASLGRLPFFGLPGNPVSTMVTFALFAAPVVAALCGERGYAPRFAEAHLAERVQPKSGLQRFLPARLSANAETATVALVPWQGSGDIAGTAQANCLLVVPEPAPGSSECLSSGQLVRVLLL
jgi:molybdopterin molybdotransferase